ncbi:MAG: hypothetical protein ACE5HC_13100 [Candidatus Binatia bacterium]
MKNASSITFAAALMFALSFPLTAKGENIWGLLRNDEGKVVATCKAEIDLVGNKTFVTLNFLKGKKGHAYTAWQKHEFTNGIPGGSTPNLDGTLAAGKTVILRGHAVFDVNDFDVADLKKITIIVRHHLKVGNDVADEDIIKTISTGSFTVEGDPVDKVGNCVIDLP